MHVAPIYFHKVPMMDIFNKICALNFMILLHQAKSVKAVYWSTFIYFYPSSLTEEEQHWIQTPTETDKWLIGTSFQHPRPGIMWFPGAQTEYFATDYQHRALCTLFTWISKDNSAV